jgi:hypothetical protein
MESAPISTLGKPFIIEDRMAVVKPVPPAAIRGPYPASQKRLLASSLVRPAFRSPSTKRYMPRLNRTICHGAPVSILRTGRGVRAGPGPATQPPRRR